MADQRPAPAAERGDALDQPRSTWRMPVKTVKKISTETRMKDSAIFEEMPMPSQITNSGARMTRGMALSKSHHRLEQFGDEGDERGEHAERDADDDARESGRRAPR